MSYPIILIVGNKGAGKDTAADIFCEQLNATKIAFADPLKRFMKYLLNFTDEQLWGSSEKRDEIIVAPNFYHALDCKEFKYDLERFGIKNGAFEKWYAEISLQGEKFSPRFILQTFGTDCVRKINPDLWVDLGIETANKILSKSFPYSKEAGVSYSQDTNSNANSVVITDGRFRNEILKIKELGGFIVKVVDPHAVNTDMHSSETEQSAIPDSWFDIIIVNNKKAGLPSLKYFINYYINKVIDPNE